MIFWPPKTFSFDRIEDYSVATYVPCIEVLVHLNRHSSVQMFWWVNQTFGHR